MGLTEPMVRYDRAATLPAPLIPPRAVSLMRNCRPAPVTPSNLAIGRETRHVQRIKKSDGPAVVTVYTYEAGGKVGWGSAFLREYAVRLRR
jgi:hypothetical protein